MKHWSVWVMLLLLLTVFAEAAPVQQSVARDIAADKEVAVDKSIDIGKILEPLIAQNPAGAGRRARVIIKPPYPIGPEYVFVCKTPVKFRARTYDWDFKDGDVLYDVRNRNVFHRYTTNGVYTPTCTATNLRGRSIYGWTTIEVTSA